MYAAQHKYNMENYTKLNMNEELKNLKTLVVKLIQKHQQTGITGCSMKMFYTTAMSQGYNCVF